MNGPDPQLVRQIADMVMAALSQQPAAVRPPAGLCPSASRAESGPRPAGPETADEPDTPQAAAPVGQVDRTLGGIITANQLADALASAGSDPVLLASDARLTPLAQDLARRHAGRLRRVNLEHAGQRLHQLTGGLPWWWWTCRASEAVTQVTRQRTRLLLPCSVPRSGRSLGQAVADLARAVDSGRVAGGLLFVWQAARAMCLANRFRCLRAILGHSDQAVVQGVEEIGANVLVLEFAQADAATLGRRVDRFLAGPHGVPAEMRHFLAEVER